ncbi:sulfatase [Natrarchaeobaculum sulfurireducens]|uniref:Arylsulfatase A n=1 Tax=Natrarchaeobaculum sulfurireducens TaxID=2044521 RepID=A0A346PTB6_9EURY|nr:sulfatase [Natrarchaeobaculum sulfurireducens]AXR77276.1 Arylsulfatase A [Natrarchaeobaculum sulfurireducens]AXR82761.1 Choline-sulfatase [Natrarchaeobaculum sulfurireducens]
MEESNGCVGESHGTARNVVLVVFDTARAKSVGPETTSTLSELATTGTTFENAFAAAPWTLPSHASLFTGTYPSEHGAHGGHPALEDDLRTLPEAFSNAGFETVGVSNNTWITEEFGFDRGFDDLRKGWQYVQSDADMGAVVRGEDLREKLQATRRRLFDGNPIINATNILYSEVFQPAGDDGADRSTTWIANWLADRDDDRPFFLFCNFIEPHVEYDPPQEYAERFLPDDATDEEASAIRQDPRAYDCADYHLSARDFELLRGLYRAELAYVDDQLERLRRALEAAGEWEDTLFVVCGDHGEHVGEHGFFGHQYNLYDTLLHVPLVLHGGPFTDGGSRRELVQLLDLPETLCAATGVEDPALRHQSAGRPIQPEEPTDPREAVFAEYVAPQPSIDRLENRFGDLPDRVYEFDRQLRAVRTSEYKYVRGDDGFERLHHLPSDPFEETTIADTEPERVSTLRDRLETQFEPLGALEERESVAMREGTKERLADLGYL